MQKKKNKHKNIRQNQSMNKFMKKMTTEKRKDEQGIVTK